MANAALTMEAFSAIQTAQSTLGLAARSMDGVAIALRTVGKAVSLAALTLQRQVQQHPQPRSQSWEHRRPRQLLGVTRLTGPAARGMAIPFVVIGLKEHAALYTG